MLGIFLPRENKDHLARVRVLPCCISGEPAEPHHPKGLGWGTGMGQKAPDETVIPLSRGVHDEYHRIGVKSWETKYGTHLHHLQKTQSRLAINPTPVRT